MKNYVITALFSLVLIVSSGCCALSKSDEDLMRRIRTDLEESIRPALVEALHRAKDSDGDPLYIDVYKTEKVGLVDTMVESINRVYPETDEDGEPVPYEPEPLPWR